MDKKGGGGKEGKTGKGKMTLKAEYWYRPFLDRYQNIRKVQLLTKKGWKRIPIKKTDGGVIFKFPLEVK